MTRWTSHALAVAVAALLGACTLSGPQQASSARAAPPHQRLALEQADARFQSALRLMKQGETQQAQAAFLVLSREYPELSGPLTDLGILYARSRQTASALDSLERAVVANPRNVVALNWLGVLYRESGQHGKAAQRYLQALALQPDYAAAHLNLAILYDVWLRRPDDAITHYRAYLQHAQQPRVIVRAWIREIEAGDGGARTLAEAAP